MDPFKVVRATTEEEFCWGAKELSAMDPWKTLEIYFQKMLPLFKNPQKEIYIATYENERCGILILDMHGAFRGYVQSIAILESFQGKALGEKLIQFAEERIFQESPNVFLCVSSFNLKAKSFYLKMGYEEIGVLKDYIVTGLDEHLMRKTLSAWNDFKLF